MELLTGLEPVTSSLPRKCSTTELQQHFGLDSRGSPTTRWRRRGWMERVGGIEPPCAAWKAAVLPLNYTRKVSALGADPALGGARSGGPGEVCHQPQPNRPPSFALQPGQALPSGVEPWRARRGRLVGEAGFEPAKAEPSDLQSDPFGRSGIPPPGIPESGGTAPTSGAAPQTAGARTTDGTIGPIARLHPGACAAKWLQQGGKRHAPVSSSSRFTF